MGNGITILTPTGDRQEAFDICKKYVERQTVKPGQWLVIDDGNIRTEVPDWATYVRREKSESDPKHTLPLQMLESFPYIDNDYIFIFEDDDWYAPNYIELMLPFLKEHELVGLGHTTYYHVKSGYRRHANMGHASFCHTCFNCSIIGPLREVCEKTKVPTIDLQIWKYNLDRKILRFKKQPSLGIKGLPGRKGTYLHNGCGYTKDPNHKFLKDFIGEDYEIYARYLI